MQSPEAEDVSLLRHHKRKNNSHNLKVKKTFVLCYAYVCLGLVMGATGPSLLHFTKLLNKSLSDVSYIFTVRGIGYMITTVCVGLFLDKFSVNSSNAFPIPKNRILQYLRFRLNAILLMICITVMGTGMIALPFIKYYQITLLVSGITGIASGTLDCVTSVAMLRIWEMKANTYMQGLHASYGIGSFIAPLYLQIVENVMKNLGVSTPWYVTPLTLTYVTIGICMLASLFLFIFIPFVDKKPKVILAINNDEYIEKSKWWNVRQWDYQQIFAGFFTCLSLFVYCGVEGGYSGYISSYVMLYDRAHFSSSSALISSVFWLVFTLSRLIALPLSQYLSIRQMLMIDSIMCTVSLLVLCLTNNYIAVWITCVTLAFFMASQYPTTFSAPTSHLNIELSAFVTSIMILAANVGYTVYQTMLAQLLPHMFWILLGTIIMKLFFDAIILFILPKRNAVKVIS